MTVLYVFMCVVCGCAGPGRTLAVSYTRACKTQIVLPSMQEVFFNVCFLNEFKNIKNDFSECRFRFRFVRTKQVSRPSKDRIMNEFEVLNEAPSHYL